MPLDSEGYEAKRSNPGIGTLAYDEPSLMYTWNLPDTQTLSILMFKVLLIEQKTMHLATCQRELPELRVGHC